MTFLDFIDIGFIITLALLFLVSGGIMLYCYRRLNLLENTIIDHGKILQQFILNYNNQNRQTTQSSQSSQPTQHTQPTQPSQPSQPTQSTTLNNDNVNIIENTKTINLENKIVVSDEEDYSSDEEESENDDDDLIDAQCSDSDNHIILKKLDSVQDNSDEDDSDENNSDEDENITENNINKIGLINLDQEINKEGIMLSNSLELFTEINIDNSMFETTKDDTQKFIKLIDDSRFMNNITLENENENENEKNGKKNFTRLKVDELRTLVVAKNLTNIDEAQNMKKTDLIKLLQF